MKSYEVIKDFVYRRLNKLCQTGIVTQLTCKEAELYKDYIKELKVKITKPYNSYLTK